MMWTTLLLIHDPSVVRRVDMSHNRAMLLAVGACATAAPPNEFCAVAFQLGLGIELGLGLELGLG